MMLSKFFSKFRRGKPTRQVTKKRGLIYWVLGIVAGVIVLAVFTVGKQAIQYLTRPRLDVNYQSWSLKEQAGEGYVTYTLIEIQNNGLPLFSRSAKKIYIKVDKTVSPIEKLCHAPESQYEIVAGGEGENFVEMKITQEIARGRSYLLGIWNKTNAEYSFGKIAAVHVSGLNLLDEESQK